MLAQQRDLQLKRRETAAVSGGMVRSSLENVDTIFRLGASADNQFTPAVRQFSAPKSVKDTSADAMEANSEFSRSARKLAKPVRQDDTQAPKQTLHRSRDFEEEERVDSRSWGKEKKLVAEDVDYDEDFSDSKADVIRRVQPDADYRGDDVRKGAGAAPKEKTRGAERPREEEWEADPPKASPARGVKLRNSNDTEGDFSQLDLSDMRKFLTSPLPKSAGTVQCNIRRVKTTLTGHPIYSVYLKNGDIFLMSSKKRPQNKTSNYKICMSESDLTRDGANYLGKLRSNFMGTEFQIFDNGHNPKDEPEFVGQEVRNELGAITYAANVWGSRGPRKMQAALPTVDAQNKMVLSDPLKSSGEEILNKIRNRNCRDTVYLINNPPRWNEQVGAYVLNFNGRVTMASVKNFQLVDPEERSTVVLQFGRVGKDEFTMDFHYPISPFQAFAITLSSFDSKIATD
jgi:tubby-related protein 1